MFLNDKKLKTIEGNEIESKDPYPVPPTKPYSFPVSPTIHSPG